MKITYEFLTGEIVEVEVVDSLGEFVIGIDNDTFNSNQTESRRHKSYDYSLDQGKQFAAANKEIAATIATNETIESLHIAYGNLLPQQRDLIRKVFYEGLSITYIACTEGVSKGAIQDRLRKIYKKIKINLK